MTQIDFRFEPFGPGASEDLADKLERVFGAARWVHNRAMIAQWDALRAGNDPPPLNELVEMCIDKPAQQEETDWLDLVPRGVLLDELEDLADGWEDLTAITNQRSLPLKKKKDDQEIIFPRGSFYLEYVPEVGLGIELEKTGKLAASYTPLWKSIKADALAEAIKVERTTLGNYSATVFFR